MQKFDLRPYVVLTTLEFALIGIPIVQARSLSGSEYSLPRLLLLVAWLLVFVGCIWISFSSFKGSADFIKPVRLCYFSIREWLIVLLLLCWGGLALFFLQPVFLTYIWTSFPVLFNQYWFSALVLGIWSAQSLFALAYMQPAAQTGNALFPKSIQVFLVAFFLYMETAVALKIAPYSTTAYFPELAQSFLQGRLDLGNPLATKDLTFFNGKYYVSFPPLGALLMLPIVAVRGVQEFNILLFNIVFAALGVTFTFAALESMRVRRLSQLAWHGNFALAIFLGFGTSQYSMTLRGLVNFTSQVLTTTFLALALWLVLQTKDKFKSSALLAGSTLALSMLARPNIVFAWFVLAALKFHGEEFSFKRFLQWSAYSSMPVIAAAAGLFWYNQVRFESPFDFGYEYMLVAKFLINDLQTYGQFHPHFLLENLRDNLLGLPYFNQICGVLTFPPNGTSIFLTSPLLLYILPALAYGVSAARRRWLSRRDNFSNRIETGTAKNNGTLTVTWRFGAWLSIGIIALLHAVYYNSGAIQVGYRFSLDFMPIAVMLLAPFLNKKIPVTAWLLLAISIIVNYFGVLWTLHRWCENF